MMDEREKKLTALLYRIRTVLIVQNTLRPSPVDAYLIADITDTLNEPRS